MADDAKNPRTEREREEVQLRDANSDTCVLLSLLHLGCVAEIPMWSDPTPSSYQSLSADDRVSLVETPIWIPSFVRPALFWWRKGVIRLSLCSSPERVTLGASGRDQHFDTPTPSVSILLTLVQAWSGCGCCRCRRDTQTAKHGISSRPLLLPLQPGSFHHSCRLFVFILQPAQYFYLDRTTVRAPRIFARLPLCIPPTRLALLL